MLTAERVPDSGSASWDELARCRGELFQSPEWVSSLGPKAHRVGVYGRGGHLVGGFVVGLGRRAGLRIVRNPPFCQTAGPFWDERATSAIGRLEERRRVLAAMAAFLEPGRGLSLVGLSASAVDVLPFRWRGFKCVVEYTYRLPLADEGDGFLKGYDSSVRNDIRKARKDGLHAVVGLDLDGIASLQEEALRREGAAGSDALPGVRRYAETTPGAFTVLVPGEGGALAGCLILGARDTAYYLLGGHRRSAGKGAHHGAGALALHTAIAEAARRGFKTFDFEGSTIPRVEEFVRGFGGTLTPYYRVAKAWFPLECALKLRYRKYF